MPGGFATTADAGRSPDPPRRTAEEFAERFDAFSIGGNDLTQLELGIDRDSERLSELFDEHGVDSMSLNVDGIVEIIERVAEVEVQGPGAAEREPDGAAR